MKNKYFFCKSKKKYSKIKKIPLYLATEKNIYNSIIL